MKKVAARKPTKAAMVEIANLAPKPPGKLPPTKSLSPEMAAEMRMRMRINPIRGMDFEVLSRQIDSFNAGYLGEFAMTAEAIEQRDTVLKCVAPKRKKAASRNGWEVLALDDSPEAQKHKEALEYFYNNIRVTNAIDLNERGGMKLLLRQMMDAVGKKYAVHEIVWMHTPKGYTAEFRFVPLNFFENTTGKLRFIRNGFGIAGEDMPDGGWMVTVGEGVMVACAIAWMFGNLPLKDWAVYCNRHGMPGIKGLTDAARGTDEWEAMEEAVAKFAAEYAIVMSNGESIEVIDAKGAGDIPYPELVELCDRAKTRLWRGADLATMSQGNEGAGASLQGDETETLEEDDAEMLTEALQQQVDRFVIEYTFGAGVSPKAYVQVNSRNNQDVALDLKIDEFLVKHGAPVGVVSAMQRYNRPLPEGDEALLTPAKSGGEEAAEGEESAEGTKKLGNARLANVLERDRATLVLIENARPLLAGAVEEELRPLADRIEAVLRIENEAHALQAVRALRADLPLLHRQISRSQAAEQVFYRVFGAAVLNGFATGEAVRQLPAQTTT